MIASLLLVACGADPDRSDTTPTVDVVSTVSGDSQTTGESTPGGSGPTSMAVSTGPESRGEETERTTLEVPPAPEPEDDDATWFTEADAACGLAIDEYVEWKAQAGGDAAPEALALGAAAAATRAAQSISSLPEPMSAEARALRDAVLDWATAYRDLSVAMDRGSYTEVTAAGDAAQVSGDELRSLGAEAPVCAMMADDV